MNKMCCLLGKDEKMQLHFWFEYVKGSNQLGYLRHRHEENVKTDVEGTGSKVLSGDKWLAVMSVVMNFWIQ